MKREDFIDEAMTLTKGYIENSYSFDSDPQFRVNPATKDLSLVNGSDMLAEIEDSNEAVEDAAGAQGAETEDASDYQASQNPDFYPVKDFIIRDEDDKEIPDDEAIRALAFRYL